MKKYTFGLIFVIILIFAGWKIYNFFNNFDLTNILTSEVEIKPSPTPFKVPNGNFAETDISGNKYLIFWVKIPNNSEIKLIANFNEKLFGEKIAEINSCEAAINGGFYLSGEKPLGLFFTDGKTVGNTVNSNIANAFVWQDMAGDIQIARTAPEDFKSTDFIFQTGPYITPINKKLNLVSDEEARRSLLGKDNQGNVYLIIVTTNENFVDGPNLADIPIIFWNLNQKNILSLSEIVNLDGGSASFFFSKDSISNFTLKSWAPIGSMLCVTIPN